MLQKYGIHLLHSALFANCSHTALKTNLCLFNNKVGVRFAGHSKWKNIKHTKEANDRKKNLLYNKHIAALKAALYEGKSFDFKINHRLALAYEAAKKANVPVLTLNNFLAKMEKKKQNVEPQVYEYRGLGGVMVIITAYTDNKGKTRNDINYYAKRHNLKQSDGVANAFDYKGFVYWKPPADVTNPEEAALDDAIEVGAEEIVRDEEDPELIKFICDGRTVNTIRTKLEARNYKIEDAEDAYIPKLVVEVDENASKIFYDCFEKIEEIPEVNSIYTNMA